MNSDTAAPQMNLVSRGNMLDSLNAVVHRSWYHARAYARPLTRWQVPVCQITGHAAGTSEERRVIVAGWKRTVAYYISRFFEAAGPPVTITTVPLLRLPATLKRFREDCDLIVARVPGPGSNRLFDDFYLHVPEAVEARLDIPDDLATLELASNRARRNIARIRKNNLTWKVSTSEEEFKEFYDRFYLPFLRKRYGELAHEYDRITLRRAFRRGCILWILKGAKRVAGALLQPHDSVLCWRVMGALTEGEDPAKTGALSAIYLFSAECAQQHGFRWLDLGFSKASPRDGVLSHKGSWGARVWCPWKVDHDLLIGWQRFNDDIANFLHRTPLIFKEGEMLSVVTAPPADNDLKVLNPATIGQKIAMRGLQNVYVVGTGLASNTIKSAKSEKLIHLVQAGSSAEFLQAGVSQITSSTSGDQAGSAILTGTVRQQP